MPRALKHLFAIVFVVLVVGCSGGGCGAGCASCGLTPLPEGFDAKARIENAGSARLTQSGLLFLQENAGTLAKSLLGASAEGGVLTFEVPSTSGSQLGIDYKLCPDGPNPEGNPPTCTAEIDIGNADLTVETKGPHNIHVSGPLPLRLQDLPIHITYFGFIESDIDGVLNGNDVCPGEPQQFAQIPVDVNISIEIDGNAEHSRYGYSRVKVQNLTINEEALQGNLHFCGGFDASILNALKGIVFGQLIGPLLETLQSQIDQQLCQKANPEIDPPCPNGTTDVDGICRYGADDKAECASIILGTDGNLNLGQLLAGISPGTKGSLDVLFAAGGATLRDDNSGWAWGDLNPIGGGATLGLYGGAEPKPVSGCVKLADVPLPTGIPIPEELLANTVEGWPGGLDGPHVGIGISERFANYALAGMYNSGLLCIGVTTDTVDLLNSGTISLLAASMKDLTLQREPAPIALVVRPSTPPRVTFGNGANIETDPLIRVSLDQASFDFYVWSLDRFIRFMTATFDLDVPVNLTVTSEGLVPVVQTIGVNNGKVSNTGLLREDPAVIADALAGLIAGQVGQAVGGGLSPIALNDQLASLGLTLTIPESVDGQGSPGLRRLQKGEDGYLGIFASFGLAQQAKKMQAETLAEILDKTVDPAGLRLRTITKTNAPRVRLRASSPLDTGARPVEYSYRIDQGVWHPWTRSRVLDIQDDWLRVQARHVVHVRARVAGDGATTDPTPAEVEVVIDAEAPSIAIDFDDEEHVALSVEDAVARADETLVRVRFDDGAWSPWKPAAELARLGAGDAHTIHVEAKDPEGNIRTATQAIVRGKAVQGAGCGCAVAGEDAGGLRGAWAAGLAALGAAVWMARRRRTPIESARTAAAAAAVVALAGAWSGCSCGETEGETGKTDSGTTAGCGDTCVTLKPGLIGAYTSVAVAGSTIWVAGYAEADWSEGNTYQWGDLAVGRHNGTSVEWQLVDGVPTDPPVDATLYDTSGFRGGQTAPGDDVGLWTSIAVDSAGNPAVAYYDRTHRSLKFAQLQGDAWKTHTIEARPNADVGRYAKLVFVGGGAAVAYQIVEPIEGGKVSSKVRLATSSSATPAEGQWTFEDVAVSDATPCRAAFCGAGTVCVKETGACTPELGEAGCPAKCGSGTACVDQGGAGACVDIYAKTKLDTYPDAIGDYIALAPDGKGGVGITFYDRILGNLVIASKASGAWTTLVVDGQTAEGVDTGDVGIGASLAIDGAGDWHLTYVDGHDEAIAYVKVSQGTTVGAPEIIDDGLELDGLPFEDGLHLVGDDSKILLTPSGEVHATYQDATAGKLRYAVGAPNGDVHTWTVRAIEQDGFAGAFSAPIQVDGQLRLVNWWRVGGQTVGGDVRLVSP